MGITSNKSSQQASRVSTKLRRAQLEILGEERESVSGQEQEEEDEKDKESDEDEENDGEGNQYYSKNSRVSYENRIVPAVLHKNKKDIKSLLNSGENLEDAAYEDN